MAYRILYYAFSLAGIALLGAAGYAYWLESDRPGAAIDQLDREFPALVVGENSITYRLHNPTRHPVRIVGCSSC